MDRPSVYIETSIVSYLAARPSRDPVTVANQRLTHAWWNERRHEYELVTSPLTWLEAARGDETIAQRRLALLASLTTVAAPLRAGDLARMLHKGIPLPDRAESDAEHIALAAVHGIAYLLTWDSKHIANPRLKQRIEAILGSRGYASPVLCTPEDLMR
jgi:predicted nucleic acid-binding protein